jgi:hypothetical protein
MEIMTRIGVLRTNDLNKRFNLYWLDGKVEPVEGTDIKDACRNAGIGDGALSALDYWEQAK